MNFYSSRREISFSRACASISGKHVPIDACALINEHIKSESAIRDDLLS